MKASVIGARSRLGSSTWSGRPVECNAEQITGTPASHPARRPQNILSPPVPTVTTASIRRAPTNRASRHSTRKSYFPARRPLEVGISCSSVSPSGPTYFRQHNSGNTCERSIRRISSTSDVSAPPTRMHVITNITRNGPRSSKGTKFRPRRRIGYLCHTRCDGTALPPPFSAHLEETPSRGLTNKSISQLPDMAVFGSGGRRENCANPKPGKELEKRQRGEVPGIG